MSRYRNQDERLQRDKESLFGGRNANSRIQSSRSSATLASQGDRGGSRYSGYGSSYAGERGYDGRHGSSQYEDRRRNGVTAENATEEDVDYVKSQIKNTKTQTMQSSRNALRMVMEAEANANNTMNQLGSQSEMLNRIEHRLDVSQVHAETAAEKAGHLKSLNRSMFVPHFHAPWSNKKRAKERIAKAEAEHLAAQQRTDDLRAQQRDTRNRVREAVGGSSGTGGLIGASDRASRDTSGNYARYQFEADEEDDGMERELDRNLGDISDAVGHLKNLALGMNSEIERQNGSIGRITGKVDVTGATLAGGSSRLKSIK